MYFLIALVLQTTTPDVAAPAQPAAEAPVTAPAAQAQAPTAQTAPGTPQTEVRCRWYVPTGQRLRHRVCETVELIEDRAVIAETATQDLRNNRGISQ